MAEEPNKISKTNEPHDPAGPGLPWILIVALLMVGAGFLGYKLTVKPANRVNGLSRPAVKGRDDYFAHEKAGDEAVAKKQYDQAALEYRLALKMQNTPEVHEHLGQALLKMGDSDAALSEFQEALQLDPHKAGAASEWGLALVAEGKPEEAARVLQDALQRNTDSGLLHYNLATTLLQMQVNAEGRRRAAIAAGKNDAAQAAETEVKKLATDALRQFSTASSNKFDSSTFWGDYGQLLNQLGQYTEAEGCLIRSGLEDANVAETHFQLALAEDHLGKYADAIEHYEKVLQLRPNDLDTLNNLALLYASATNAELRTPKMAMQLATRACDATTDQNARYMDTLARCCAEGGDFFQAITWEDKAIHRATQLGDKDLARELREREDLFMDHKTR